MKAIVCEAYGPVDDLVLRELPEPVPGPGEIRLQISAVGVNFPDALLVRGLYQVKPDLPFVPGIECAGTIDALGEGVSGFEVGDRVAAMSPRFGTYAQAVVVPASHAYLLPANLEFTQAGGLLCAHGTAYHALVQRGSLQAGETLLVTGAAGGTGLAAVQIGCALRCARHRSLLDTRKIRGSETPRRPCRYQHQWGRLARGNTVADRRQRCRRYF